MAPGACGALRQLGTYVHTYVKNGGGRYEASAWVKNTQPEGAGKPRRPGNGCFAALALKYTWRYICAYFQRTRVSKYAP